MAISKDDWKAINKAIEAAVEPLKPSGWKKALHVTREWGVLGVSISVILALLALSASQFYQANTRLAKEAAFEATTDQSLKGIQADIAGIKTDVAKLNLSLSVSKPIAQFKASLPDLRSSIAVAQKQKAKISPALMADLQSKLSSVGVDAPNYWSTVADFITYRSFNTASWSLPANLPNCRDTKPSTATQQVAFNFNAEGKQEKLEVKLVGYHNCRLSLDSTVDGDWINTLIESKAYLIFKTCEVVYGGGSIVARFDIAHGKRILDKIKHGIYGAKISASDTIQFDDCIFDFAVQQSPTEQAKALTVLVLSQNEPTIKLPIAKSS